MKTETHVLLHPTKVVTTRQRIRKPQKHEEQDRPREPLTVSTPKPLKINTRDKLSAGPN
ncbi:MAG: hypothetical protein PV362_09880 [Providencia heimbachae]|nr:hypothetical protein [Providencia heimbachae]